MQINATSESPQPDVRGPIQNPQPSPSPELRGRQEPPRFDPYDRGHYVYDREGNPIGLTDEYAAQVKENNARLKRAIRPIKKITKALSTPAVTLPPPIPWMVWGLDEMLDEQLKIEPVGPASSRNK